MFTVMLLIFMLLMHTIADFHLQGDMKWMKCKEWWMAQMNNVPPAYHRKMRAGFIPVLMMHGLEWSIMIHLPAMAYALLWGYTVEFTWILLLSVILQALIHTLVDHLRCNCYAIGMVLDQIIHIVQVVSTFLLLVLVS